MKNSLLATSDEIWLKFVYSTHTIIKVSVLTSRDFNQLTITGYYINVN